MKIENTVVEKCRKALELCPHEKGTVNVMCRVDRHLSRYWPRIASSGIS